MFEQYKSNDPILFNPYKLFTGSFIPNCLREYPNLHSTDKLMWSTLAQHAGENGDCFPSQDILAKELGITEKAVNVSIKRLVKKGFICKTNPKGLDRLSHKTNRYNFILHGIFKNEIRDKKVIPGGNLQVTPVVNSNDDVSSLSNKKRLLLNDDMSVSKRRKPLSFEIDIKKSPPKGIFNKEIDHTSKRISILSASEEAQEIVKIWNDLKCGRTSFSNSNPLEKAIYLLDQKLIEKYSKETIIKTIEIFSEMKKSPDRYLIPRKKLSLFGFLTKNRYSRTPCIFELIMKNGKARMTRDNSSKDKFIQDLADKIKDYYMRRVLAEEEVIFTWKQNKNFYESAKQLKDYMKKKRVEKYIEGANEKDYIRIMFKALANRFKLQFSTANLASVYTFNDIIPKYLSENFELKRS